MRSRKPARETATPLRQSVTTFDPSDAQEDYLAAFMAACVIGHVDIYATRYQSSGAIKLKLYADGESYEDVLNVQEEWGTLFDDYSRTVGVRPHYQALVKRIHAARAAERAADVPAEGPEGEDTAPPTSRASGAGSKPLRAK